MNDADRDASILENLERVLLFFVNRLLAWRGLEKAHRPARVPLLPEPGSTCSFISSLRVIYLVSTAHSSIQQRKVLTKRDIYYMCRHLFSSPAAVDRGLLLLSSIIGVDRNDLNIVAAPKGIVVGNVLYVDESANEVNVAMFGIDGCLIPSRPERIARVSITARAIIIIEKEASFHSLLHEEGSTQFFNSCVIVTGKGYPDHATRNFVRRLILASKERKMHIPTYILTDADPHGISIAMCYLSSLSEPTVKWLGVKPSDDGMDFKLDSRSRLPLQQPELALLETLLKRCSGGLQKDIEEYGKLKRELCVLRDTKIKFEMEALSVVHHSSGVSGLLHYLISKICEDAEGRSPKRYFLEALMR